MNLKKKIGEILEDLGIVSQPDLKAALKQRVLTGGKMPPERLDLTRLVAENRKRLFKSDIPLLGQLLITMGAINEEQVLRALQVQKEMIEKYFSAECEALVSVMEMAGTVNSSLNLVEVLSLLMENANMVTQAEASTLMLLDEITGDLVFSVPTGPVADKLIDVRLKRGQGIAGWVVENEKPVIVHDVSHDDRFSLDIDKLSDFKTQSVLAVPLKAKGELVGVLELINKADGSEFNEEDALLLTIYSEQAGMAIENARLYGELQLQIEHSLRMQEELARSEKFRALAQLSAGFAHDFRNILNAIMGFAEILMLDVEKEQTREDIEEILKASDRAADLVNQILIFTTQSGEKQVPVSSSNLVNQATKLFQANLPGTIEFREKLIDVDLTLTVDPGQIHQLIMNLLENARDAIGPDAKGTVEVETGLISISREGLENHPGLKAGDYFRLTVRDDGCGMDASVLDQVFEPYFTTKEKKLGTGMGLATVQGSVKAHGGSIHIESSPGKGTACEVLLPRSEQPVIEGQDRTFDQLSTGTERILIVDDEEPLVRLLGKMLRYLGYQVTPMTDSEDALATFRDNPDEFDIVITDLAMPKIKGDKLARKMLESRKDIPIILWTAFEEEVDETHFSKIGIRARLKKPVAMADLAGTIREVLDQT
jgi:signal transduction histidine kinase